jgi:hypothetical protein
VGPKCKTDDRGIVKMAVQCKHMNAKVPCQLIMLAALPAFLNPNSRQKVKYVGMHVYITVHMK